MIDNILLNHTKLLYVEARKFTNDSYLIEDLVQEGRISIWKAVESFDSSRGSLEARLIYKVRMRMKTYFSKYCKESLKTTNYFEVDMDYRLEDSLEIYRQDFKRAFVKLTPLQQKYVYMKFWCGSSTSEFKEVFGYNPRALWSLPKYGAKFKLYEDLLHFRELI